MGKANSGMRLAPEPTYLLLHCGYHFLERWQLSDGWLTRCSAVFAPNEEGTLGEAVF